jgi:hypothetical protein
MNDSSFSLRLLSALAGTALTACFFTAVAMASDHPRDAVTVEAVHSAAASCTPSS